MRPLLLLALLSLVVGCSRDERAAVPAAAEPPAIPFRTDATLRFVRADGTPITEIAVEIAETDSTRERGLMERPTIPPRTGMLFLMPQTQVQSFYMANTPHSLDIMYVGEDSVLINVAEYTTPYSISTVNSEAPARFVVETAAGFADTHGLAPGDRITWTRFAEVTRDSAATP